MPPRPENLNTEIGLPLASSRAPADTEALVLEMAMRGPGQIAQLTAIAEPDVGVIVNVGPAHLELLGSLEAIAAAKAELLAGLAPGASAVLPAGEPLLEPHLRDDIRTITFGEGGDVALLSAGRAAPSRSATAARDRAAAVLQSGAPAEQPARRRRRGTRASASRRSGPVNVSFSAMRGQRSELPRRDGRDRRLLQRQPDVDARRDRRSRRGATAGGSPCSETCSSSGRRAGAAPRRSGGMPPSGRVDLLVSVGPLAREIAAAFDGERATPRGFAGGGELLAGLVRTGDTVLVKGSRGMGWRSSCGA